MREASSCSGIGGEICSRSKGGCRVRRDGVSQGVVRYSRWQGSSPTRMTVWCCVPCRDVYVGLEMRARFGTAVRTKPSSWAACEHRPVSQMSRRRSLGFRALPCPSFQRAGDGESQVKAVTDRRKPQIGEFDAVEPRPRLPGGMGVLGGGRSWAVGRGAVGCSDRQAQRQGSTLFQNRANECRHKRVASVTQYRTTSIGRSGGGQYARWTESGEGSRAEQGVPGLDGTGTRRGVATVQRGDTAAGTETKSRVAKTPDGVGGLHLV